ncbi:MAG: malonyl-ACP O-methyltransferase BioC [Gammaproteobacteria bacterium]
MSAKDPYQLDKSLVRRSFDRAAAGYEQVAVLQREVGKRLVERLDLINMTPHRILDLGIGCGGTTNALMERYCDSRLVALDLSESMLQQASNNARQRKKPAYICGDMENVPCANAGFDLIFSNLTLQWCNNVGQALGEFARLLKPGGMVLFTTFGPDTLKELRASWAKVDSYTHVNGFFDMHDIGDALIQCGLAEPVMDTETLTLTYPSLNKLMRDLKELGAHNVTAGRPRGLTGKGKLRTLKQAYEVFRLNGSLPATFEVIYGHAWAPAGGKHVGVEVPLDSFS